MSTTAGKGKTIKGHHPILDGDAHIYQVKVGKLMSDIWQFRMWIPDEKKHYRRSLKTTNFDTAVVRAKEIALDLSSSTRFGKQVFGINLQELVELYVDYRAKDIGEANEDITYRRWLAIKSQLKHFVTLLGKNTKLSSLDEESLFEYRQRRNQLKLAGVGAIKNEQAIINHCMKFAYRHKHTNFEKFRFRKLSSKGDAIGRRDTFTDEEYDRLIKFMRVWTKASANETQRLERKLIQDFVLISCNTMLRPGEAKQLLYKDILHYEEGIDELGKKQLLVKLYIRKEISKVREAREFLTRGGRYFKRLTERQRFTEPHHLVFSMDGVKTIPRYKLTLIWKELMEGSRIENHKERKIQWYSCRHWAITMRVQHGVKLPVLSKMAGTDIKNIMNTYYKFSDEDSRIASLQTEKKNKDEKNIVEKKYR